MNEQIRKQFIDLSLTPASMFFYVPRTGILRAVREAAADFHGVVLDAGCGFMPYRELVESNERVARFIGMDIAGSELYGEAGADLIWEGNRVPMDDASVDCVMATEFLEHHSDPGSVLEEFHRVLRPGGTLFATVPFIWNLHEIPHDEYRYTPYSLHRIIDASGFTDIQITGLGGWNASMAQMIGLWINFANLPEAARSILRVLIFPLFFILVRTDRPPETFDAAQNSMFTGLAVTAKKPA